MNDWIIWVILVLVISEIIFIIGRIKFNDEGWIMQKVFSILFGIAIGTFHLFWLAEDTRLGDPFIFHWERLIYEFYIICAIALFFAINYFITKLIDKFVFGRVSE